MSLVMELVKVFLKDTPKRSQRMVLDGTFLGRRLKENSP